MERCYSCMREIHKQNTQICPHCGQPLEQSCDTTKYLRYGTCLQSKFVVGKVMGDGGFGNTYIGWNQLLQCRVAIKEYYPKHLCSRQLADGKVVVADSRAEQRFRAGLVSFLEEARSIASLQDVKGVTQVYSFFEANGTGYIVMEYLEGMDVKQILKKRGNTADYEWSRRVILTVLHTLREIHKRGVLHRDIAPDNVFVTKEGVIKLIDFGAAKHTAEMGNAQGEIMLKTGYAPIEQYSNRTKQGPYTDLYAVAAMFYRLLTGQKPQAADERYKEDHLKTISEIGVQIPEQAEMGIMVCLNILPQYRLQNAADFMEALGGRDYEPVYEPEWILPVVKESGYAAISFRKKLVMTAGVVLAVVALCCGVGYSLNNRGERKHGYRADEKLPQLIGKSLSEAEESMEALGLNMEIAYRLDTTAEDETITAMQPEAGVKLPDNGIVSLTVLSSERLTIPSYVGMNEEEVEKDLSERLEDKYVENHMISHQYSGKVAKGAVISQTVTGDVEVSDVEKIVVHISWGKQSAYEKKMPNLKGKTKKQAQKLLKQVGLLGVKIATKSQEYSDSVEKGKILRQKTKAGTKYNTNQADKKRYNVPKKVTVVVSKGKKLQATSKPGATRKAKAASRPKKSNRVQGNAVDDSLH